MSLTIKLLLAPLLLVQAVRTRARAPRLPEAAGARQGRVGSGPLLRLLILGDSSAAGVGVATQHDALASRLAQELAAHAGVRVAWRLLAKSGLTTAQTLQLLQGSAPHDEPREALGGFDLALVVTGVNDVADQVPTHHAVAARDALANWLRNGVGVAHVVFAPLPPVHLMPGLPQPLRWVSGADARRHDRALRDWAQTRGDVSRVTIDMGLPPSALAIDGLHPGRPVYRHTARAIAWHIAREVCPTLQLETDHDPQPARQDPAHHRLEPGHRPGDRQARGGRRRQHRAGGQDDRAQPQAAGHAVQRRG